MTTILPANCVVIDDFLDQSLLDALTAYALAQEGALEPTGVGPKAEEAIDRTVRDSVSCKHGLGDLEATFTEKVLARFDEIAARLGMRPFKVAKAEIELIAHGDGAKYVKHTDTYTEEERLFCETDRVITIVFYFHRQPKAFEGGEIAVHPFGKGEPELLPPRNNRLIAFPSFALHEVRKVTCPSGQYADSRFAINCWLHRARKSGAAGAAPL